ncbi:amino acid permease [Microbacterium sp. M3]|uniref:Amino acid permease n=1 Tax=Microbacterium arthrosphaerae TaxID=792652 RepID=A0ABU4H1U6_9MICO|nr:MULTISPECIES: amino acid permease [Microbacterium]MDW4573303.1 amino acid permease [Microbacterium arthrosphaerae]MDW7607158.1 amino acid permease [Microbacterium sp. M3]
MRSDRRAGLGIPQGTALYIASVLGTGLLLLPGLAAEVAGPASIVAVLAVIALSVPLAGTFAALAARYPDPGGVASYVRRALGRTAARATGYWFFFGVAAGVPVLAALGAEYLTAVLHLDRMAVPILMFGLLLPPFVVNMLGVRTAGAVQFVLTGLLVGIVVFVVAAAFPAVEASRFTPFLPHGWTGVGTAISLFVWAFAGWEVGTHISGEFRDARRSIPIATAIALVVTGLAYLLLQIVTVGVLGDAAGDGAVPLLSLADAVAPGFGPTAVGAVAAIVVLGVMNAYVAAFGKLGASLAAAGDLPRVLAPGAETGGVPRRALLLTFAIAVTYCSIALVTGGDLRTFILIHTSNMVSIYTAGMIAATLILPRLTTGWFMAVVAAVLSAGLLVLAGGSLIPAALLALAAVIVTLWQRVRRSPSARGSRAGAPASTAADSERSAEVKTAARSAARDSALDVPR